MTAAGPKHPKLFGTDGIRGQANEFPMTGEIAMAVGRAIAHVLRNHPSSAGKSSPAPCMSALRVCASRLMCSTFPAGMARRRLLRQARVRPASISKCATAPGTGALTTTAEAPARGLPPQARPAAGRTLRRTAPRRRHARRSHRSRAARSRGQAQRPTGLSPSPRRAQ